jgi:Fe-S-cluster containining protein
MAPFSLARPAAKIIRMAAESKTDQPWYQNGLRFRCTMCGHCCTGAPGFVWVTDEEIQVISEFLHEPMEIVIAARTRVDQRGRSLREKQNGDCVFYDKTAGCTIYPARPSQCRTWPFWDSNVGTPKDWQHTCEICPGSGQGELIPPEEITRRLNVIRL